MCSHTSTLPLFFFLSDASNSFPVWRINFSHALRVDLLVRNYFPPFSEEYFLFLLHFWRIVLLIDNSFFFSFSFFCSTWKTLCPFLPASMISTEKSVVTWLHISFLVIYHLSLAAFRSFPLSLVFSSFIVM